MINTSWKHIYHNQCLIDHCRDYLSRCQYPKNCPSRGCKKILGPQEVTKYLSPGEYIKFEAFSLQRSGQKSRKQLLWCPDCHLIYAVGYDDKVGNWSKWSSKPMKFQDILKHLNFPNKNKKMTIKEARKSRTASENPEKSGGTEKEEDWKVCGSGYCGWEFIASCKGIVERCKMCLKRRIKIIGYKYEICICEKVSMTIKAKKSLGLISEDFHKFN